MTETMQQYSELMELMEYIPEFDLDDIVTYAGFVSKSAYLDIYKFFCDTTPYVKTTLYRQFANVMDEKIYYETFPETCDEPNQMEILMMSSFMAYCVMAKLVHPQLINIKEEDFQLTQNKEKLKESVVYNKVISAINVWLSNEDTKNFFEVTLDLKNDVGKYYYEVYEIARQILYNSLDRHFGTRKMYFEYWVSAKMREFQLQADYPKQLNDAIVFSE